MPVPRAVFTLALPTVISQLVTMIYNLADTFFLGQLTNPLMVAAVSLVYPWYHLFVAIGNLFGGGSASLISRMLGAKREEEVKYVSAFGFYGALTVGVLFALFSQWKMGPILDLLGASPEDLIFAQRYYLWVVVIGAAPTLLSLVLSHMLRSIGSSGKAGFGLMLGGVLNMVLDPIFIFGLGLDVAGAAIATVISNGVSTLYFIYTLCRSGDGPISIHPVWFTTRYAGEVFSVGFATALVSVLASTANMLLVKLAAKYGDVAVAAYGIVKKVDQLPFYICLGICQGTIPLIGYNFASRDRRRMREIVRFSWRLCFCIALSIILLLLLFARPILYAFLPEEQTCALGTTFLRIACLAVPFNAVNFFAGFTLQAIGHGGTSTALTICRQGALNIPLMFLLERALGMNGIVLAQPIAEMVMLPIFLVIYAQVMKRENRKLEAES